MGIKVILFDVSFDPRKDVVELWFKRDGEVVRETRKFKPRFYVETDLREDLYEVLRTRDVDIGLSMKKKWPGKDEQEFVEIGLENPLQLYEVARDVYRSGGYREHLLYNVDLSLPFRYLLRNDLYPTISGEGRDKYDLDYRIPDLDTIEVDVETVKGFLNSDYEIERIIVGGEEFKGDNNEVISFLERKVEDLDPDIIFTRPGVMKYLLERFDRDLDLGREKGVREIEERTIESYGRTIHKPSSLLMRGRVHINKNSFIYSESGLDGVLDLARISNRPLHEVVRASPGTIISSMQIALAHEKDILVPWKKTVPEDFKKAGDLIKSDRGGLTLQPRVGFHKNIIEVDFSSLFPNIISKKNISPETINCECCDNNKVPQINYTVCKKRGFLPEVVEPIIKRREKLKRRTEDGGSLEDRRRVVALKWILVTCFGYTGYKNAKYGKIECHESICAYGRDIITKTTQIAEKTGYEVVHGVVDSLWLSGDGDLKKFIEKVEEEIEIPLDIESKYRWMVFLPRRRSKTGALNRYYGVKKNGETKVRGIELRRKDMPKIVKEFQKKAIKILKKSSNKQEYMEKQKHIIETLEKYKRKIKNNEVPKKKLVYTSKTSKKLEKYKNMNRNTAALIKYREKGCPKKPGEKIKYVVRDSDSKTRDKVGLVDEETKIDKKHYIELLERAYRSLQPNKKTIDKKQKTIKQKY